MNKLNANGQRHGLWGAHYSNGELGWKGNFVNGKFHGPFEEYYADGKLCLKGFYLNDQEIGFWVDGSPSGIIFKRFIL